MTDRVKPHAPLLAPAEGWVPVNPFPSLTTPTSFVTGSQAADRTRVAYFREPANDHLYACVGFGPASEGPPGNVHGGAIAAVLDEAMGAVCWMNGHPVVAARITINYTSLTPLGFAGRVESWIETIARRKIFIKSRLTGEDGKVHAEGDALFIKLSPELAESLSEARKRRDRGAQ
jgi:acyl-coenzyme A thioesterase PaaI-like protein